MQMKSCSESMKVLICEILKGEHVAIEEGHWRNKWDRLESQVPPGHRAKGVLLYFASNIVEVKALKQAK